MMEEVIKIRNLWYIEYCFLTWCCNREKLLEDLEKTISAQTYNINKLNSENPLGCKEHIENSEEIILISKKIKSLHQELEEKPLEECFSYLTKKVIDPSFRAKDYKEKETYLMFNLLIWYKLREKRKENNKND